MKNTITMVLFLAVSLIACKNKAQESVETAPANYGEAFEATNPISYDQLLTRLAAEEEVNDVVVEGKVDAVCQKKGCWMHLVSDTNPEAEKLFVKFHDYGFFMPLDLTGGRVVMKGKAYKEVTSVEDLKHYAEDEGQSAEEIAAITEPITELKFMATGVEIKKD